MAGDLALMTANVLGHRGRALVLDLADHDGVIAGSAGVWNLSHQSPTPSELARLSQLISARSTLNGAELSLTPLGRSVATALRQT